MRKFIEEEINKLNNINMQHSQSLENVLRQIMTFTQTLVTEIASKDGADATEHSVKGLLAIEDFVRKNIDVSMINRDRVSLLKTLTERYDKNKTLAKKVVDEDRRKFRKIGEKPDSVRDARNVKKNLDLYLEEENEQAAEDS